MGIEEYWEGTLRENWQPISGEQQKAPSPFKSSLRVSSLFGSHARFILGASRERIGAGASWGELCRLTEEFSFLLRLGEAKSHWLKMTCINQFRGECRNVLNRVPGGRNVSK